MSHPLHLNKESIFLKSDYCPLSLDYKIKMSSLFLISATVKIIIHFSFLFNQCIFLFLKRMQNWSRGPGVRGQTFNGEVQTLLKAHRSAEVLLIPGRNFPIKTVLPHVMLNEKEQ